MAFLDDVIGLTGSQLASIGEDGGDAIALDASVREVHNVAGHITEHPVESGVDIVDHYRVLPRRLEIEGVISNTPIKSSFPGEALINSVVGLIEGDTDPVSNAWSELQRFFDEAVVVTITTSLKVYGSMVLTDLSVTRTAGQGQSLHFNASAQEVRFVDTQSGAAIEIPKSPLGQKTKSAGKKTNTTPAQQGQKSSTLLKSFQGLGLLQ